MELTKEQLEYVMKNQRSPENAEKLARLVKKLAERYPNKGDLHVTPEELSQILLITNIGEYHPDMLIDGVSIYSEEFGKWDDSERGKKAKELNATRGSKSVEMAQQLGIQLEPEIIQAIEATSQGKSVNLMAVLMKVAQTYEAVKHPRWSRGVKKEAAKDFNEVEEILREEIDFMMMGQEIEPEAKEQLVNGIIESVRTIYSIEKQAVKAGDMAGGILWWSFEKPLVELGMESYIGEAAEKNPEFWEEICSNLNEEAINVLINELSNVKDEEELRRLVAKYKNPVKTAVLEATSDVPQEKVLAFMEFKKTVMGGIARDALMNWNGLSREEAETKVEEFGTADVARDNVTYGSELNSIKGIAKAIGLDEKQVEQLTNDINTQSQVSTDLAKEIRARIESKGLEGTIIEILSVVHDGWVRDNANKFEARPKNYQFVDLRLLDFKEASLDLLFLQPILEACGIEINIKELKEKFLQVQEEFKKENGIVSERTLAEKISTGAEFYPVLEGLETNKGVKGGEKVLITDLLKDEEILHKMVSQVSDKANVPQFSLKDREAMLAELGEEAEKISEAELLIKLLEKDNEKSIGTNIGE